MYISCVTCHLFGARGMELSKKYTGIAFDPHPCQKCSTYLIKDKCTAFDDAILSNVLLNKDFSEFNDKELLWISMTTDLLMTIVRGAMRDTNSKK